MDESKKELRRLNKLAWERGKGGTLMERFDGACHGTHTIAQKHPRISTATLKRTPHLSRNARRRWAQTCERSS